MLDGQVSIFLSNFYKLKEHHQIYGIDILRHLFYNSSKGLNISEIYCTFNNYNTKTIRKTIALLENINISAIKIDTTKSVVKEKRYRITDVGQAILNQVMFH